MSPAPQEDDLAELPWPKPATPSVECSQAIRRECTQGLCAKRGASAKQRLLGSLTISTLTVGLVFWLAKTTGHDESTLRSALYGAAGWGVVMTIILSLSLARPPGRRGSVTWRVLVAVLLPVAFFGYLAYAATSHVAFDAFSHGARASHAVRCGFVALGLGALVSTGIMLCFRRTDPLNPGVSGAIVGLTGGLTSAVAVGIGCPSHEAWHLWAAHGMVLVALVLVGWGVGRRVLSP